MADKERIAQLEAALRPFALFSGKSDSEEVEYGDELVKGRVLTRADFDHAWDVLIERG